jgi:quercetin dioxygenase-like cupin family protein
MGRDHADAGQETAMSDLVDLADLPFLEIWGEQVRARRLEGERITLAVVELAPGAVVPEHRHAQEQLGICVKGSVRFRIGEEVRDLGPGGTWRIASGVPHEVVAGPEGSVAIDVFSPTRDDWDFPMLEPEAPRWP